MPTPAPIPTLASTHRTLRTLLACALLAGIALTSLNVRQVDLWWQLPEGLHLLRHGHLPQAPPAAFGLPRQPYLDEYSLYEIGLALLDRLGGLTAIWLAFIAAYLLIFALPLASARAAGRDPLALGLLALAGIFLVNRYEQRPEIIGALLLVVLLQLLTARPGHPVPFSFSFLLRLALLFALWTNIHSSFLVGLLALLLWLTQRVLTASGPRFTLPQAALTLATAAGAVLINPYGWPRVAFAFEQDRDPGSNLLSREMWPAWDQSLLTQSLLLLTAALLAAAFLPRRRPAPWLIAFTLAMLALSLHGIRHISFLAVALLAVAAHRPPAPLPARPRLAATALLALACIAALLFDLAALRDSARALAHHPSRSDQPFAPGLVAQLAARGPAAVLCHDAAGSYLTFAGAGALRPLLDSGQGHFNDATKRCYFFLEQDPRAFALVLAQLHLDAILITRPTAHWLLALDGQPAWHLAAANDAGLLFIRARPGAPETPSPDLAPLIARARRDRDPIWAFCLAARRDPQESLALLDRSRLDDWSEPFLNFLRPWLDRVPAPALAAFLRAYPAPGNPLLRELILQRVEPRAPLSAPGSSRLGKTLRVLDLLQRGDLPAARRLLATLPPPPLSTLDRDLRDRLDPAAAETASEKWQDWNAGGPELFRQLIPQLNRRLALPAENR